MNNDKNQPPAASGTWIRTLEGYKAFNPNKLPPEIEWTPDLVRTLSQADLILGRLAGEGLMLPNPHVLLRPFIKKEAVFSSKIEGTQATLGEILAAEAGAKVKRSPDDLKEVNNYICALDYGIQRLKTLPLSLRLVCELHEKLLTGVRGDHGTPGAFRITQNWIGRAGCTLAEASYVPPHPHEMKELLSDWELFLYDRSLPTLIHAAIMHYQFEAIHPFIDGNGRIGRLMITLLLYERNILPVPLLYLSAFFEATRQEYYQNLKSVSMSSTWNEWFLYFLTGINKQAEDSLSRTARINQLLLSWKKELIGTRSKLSTLAIDSIGSNPFISAKELEKKFQVSFATATRAIELLQEKNILTLVQGEQRNRVYCAEKILNILEEPASFIRNLAIEPSK